MSLLNPWNDQPLSEKGQANGYAGLDGTGKVPSGNLPASSVAWGSVTGTLSAQTDLQNALDAKTTLAAVKDAIYPIGSVYCSVVSTSPATFFGGTWAAFGAGKVMVGLDSTQTEFDTVEETGGEKTHTLTSTEMPSHTHVQDSHNHTQNSHNHTQDSHNHTQDAHTHTQNSHTHNLVPTTATTGSATCTQAVFATDTSATAGTPVASANISTATAVNQNATATNQAATATNQAATATNQATIATNQSTGEGGAHNNLQPYIVVYMWKRTA